MKKVDWSYHRRNCNTCALAQEFLTSNKVKVAEQVDARTVPIPREEALRFARQFDEIVALKGKAVRRLSIKKDKPGDDDIAALVIGPSGKLRAPSLQVGKTLLVGFDESVYREVLK